MFSAMRANKSSRNQQKQARMSSTSAPPSSAALLANLSESYHVRYCAHLGASEMLTLAALCTAARHTWLPSTDAIWWNALLKMAGLQGDGVRETIATAVICTAKEALLRLAPLVRFRQEGVAEEGCMGYTRDAIQEVVVGFMYIPLLRRFCPLLRRFCDAARLDR